MTVHTLQDLCRALRAEFEHEAKGKAVARLLTDYSQNASDWGEYSLFNQEQYTRNLLHRCADFELLLLCWQPGQESPIHDHSDQDCWMAVLDGELEEVHYTGWQSGATGPLVEGKRSSVPSGRVAYIQDGIALHRIRPLGDENGVSLHLYANPIDTCQSFDPLTGEAHTVELGYQSVLGRPCDRSAAAIRAEWVADAG